MKSDSSLWSQLRTWCLFLTLFVFSSVLETEDVPRFRILRIQKCVGELGAVIQEENKTSTLIVLIFRILRSSTANTTIPCHTSNSLHYFSGLLYCILRTLSNFI